MAISFVGSATGTTSATLPAHQAGDLIVAFAFRDGSTALPTQPAGWTSLSSGSGSSCSHRTAYQFATSSSTATGTWSSATSTVFLIYRNVVQIGNYSVIAATSATVTFDALGILSSYDEINGNESIVVGFVGHRSVNGAIQTAPIGMVNRTSVVDATDAAAGHDTNASVSVFDSRTAALGGTSSGYITAVIELIDGSVLTSINGQDLTSSFATIAAISSNDGKASPSGVVSSTAFTAPIGINGKFVTIAVVGTESLADNFIYPETSNWHPWYFGPRTIGYSGESNVLFDGISASSDFSEITAIGEQSAEVQIDGITLTIESSDVSVTISDSEIINGVEAISFAGQATATADAYFEQFGLSAETSFAEISQQANANGSIDGNQLNISVDSVSAIADSVSVVSGNQAVSEFGEVSAFSNEQSNASVELDGIDTTASLGNVSAISESPETWSSGQIKRYPANQFVSATAKTASVSAKFEVGEIQTNATTVINATISLNNVVSFVQASDINASGTLEISDEELILLLAA